MHLDLEGLRCKVEADGEAWAWAAGFMMRIEQKVSELKSVELQLGGFVSEFRAAALVPASMNTFKKSLGEDYVEKLANFRASIFPIVQNIDGQIQNVKRMAEQNGGEISEVPKAKRGKKEAGIGCVVSK